MIFDAKWHNCLLFALFMTRFCDWCTFVCFFHWPVRRCWHMCKIVLQCSVEYCYQYYEFNCFLFVLDHLMKTMIEVYIGRCSVFMIVCKMESTLSSVIGTLTRAFLSVLKTTCRNMIICIILSVHLRIQLLVLLWYAIIIAISRFQRILPPKMRFCISQKFCQKSCCCTVDV